MTDGSGVAWLAWTPAAFAHAAAADKPILLSIVTTWSASCEEMDRRTYADPAVAAAIADLVVPVRVDADRRPDVAERYTLGGWPTTALLTPGGELLGGGTFVPAGRLVAALERAAAAWRTQRAELEARAARAARARAAARAQAVAREPDAGVVDWVLGRLRAEFDEVHGGFGVAPKLPHVDGLALLLAVYRRDPTAPELARLLRGSLDPLVERSLYDQVDGGFFRACARRDWSDPQTEKLLDVNAALLDVLVDAGPTLQGPLYRDRAEGIVRYVRHTLTAPEGGFFASQRADAAYYRLADPAARRAAGPPPVDPTRYTDSNGLMASAYLRAARALDDPSLAVAAIDALERVVSATYRRGEGLAHWVGDADESPRGLLADHVGISAALLDAYEASGRPVYLDLAAELMLFCRRHLWDEPLGGFVDRPPDPAEPGLLREPWTPVLANCAAARVLARLARLTERTDLYEDARRALAAVAGEARCSILSGAAYARAYLEVV